MPFSSDLYSWFSVTDSRDQTPPVLRGTPQRHRRSQSPCAPFPCTLHKPWPKKRPRSGRAVKIHRACKVGISKEVHYGHLHGEEFEFGEVFIHQVIETIEFVLGTVSHTASYLRIWALSLAHQQLSLVFFQKTITMGLEMSFPLNGIVIYLMFGAWFGITLAVLLGMDVLECFLHTLRLHWVEFQSKFYKAEGLKFAPFSVKKLLTPQDE
eukprot:s4099_g2.t1